MRVPPQPARYRPSSRTLRGIARALMLTAGLVAPLAAQDSTRESQQPAALPSAPLPAHPNPVPMHFVPSFGAAGSSLPLNPPLFDSFQPAGSFETFTIPAGNSADFRPARGFGNPRHAWLDFNSINSPDFGKPQGGSASRFPAGRASQLFAITPAALPSFNPSLNQLMRVSFNFPFTSTANSYKLAYRDSPQDLFKPSSGLFTTTDLGNGMFLTAGTSLGHTTAGVPAAGLGSNGATDAKHSGPALGLKLSF